MVSSDAVFVSVLVLLFTVLMKRMKPLYLQATSLIVGTYWKSATWKHTVPTYGGNWYWWYFNTPMTPHHLRLCLY